MLRTFYRYASVALLLAGSAILLFSCGEDSGAETPEQNEVLMTEYSENLTVVESKNGQKSYHFTTPLLEGYSQAKDPYQEFRKGVDVVTYKNDSLSSVDVTLTANYAIRYTKRDLWEAKGNVEVESSNGNQLYTQQLFWNAKTRRIYSNVDSKVVQNEGRDIYYVEGFESDEQMKDWRFRRMTGKMEFEMQDRADTTDVKTAPSSSATSAPAAASAPVKPSSRPERPQAAPISTPRAGNPNGRPRGNGDVVLPTTKKSQNTPMPMRPTHVNPDKQGKK